MWDNKLYLSLKNVTPGRSPPSRSPASSATTSNEDDDPEMPSLAQYAMVSQLLQEEADYSLASHYQQAMQHHHQKFEQSRDSPGHEQASSSQSPATCPPTQYRLYNPQGHYDVPGQPYGPEEFSIATPPPERADRDWHWIHDTSIGTAILWDCLLYTSPIPRDPM